jgi:hypothetical protein
VTASTVVINAIHAIVPPTISRRDLRPNGPDPHFRTEDAIKRSRDDNEPSGSVRCKRLCTYLLLTGRAEMMAIPEWKCGICGWSNICAATFLSASDPQRFTLFNPKSCKSAAWAVMALNDITSEAVLAPPADPKDAYTRWRAMVVRREDETYDKRRTSEHLRATLLEAARGHHESWINSPHA